MGDGVDATVAPTRPGVAHPHRSRHALDAAKGRLQKRALKLAGYLIVAYLVVKLIPSLEQALRSLQRVRWEWVVAAIAVEVLSETGFVVSWRAIVDPEDL